MALRETKCGVEGWRKVSLLLLGTSLLLAAAGASMAAPMALTGVEATQATRGDRVFQVGKDVSAPVLVKQADPEFPATLREQPGHMEAICLVALVVDGKGIPRDVHIVRSSQKAFDEEALRTVEQYRFKPGRRAGRPVAVALTVEVNFQKF